MKVNHPTISSRSSHACGPLCHSQSRARNNMYIKFIFIAQEHLTMGQIRYKNRLP